MLHRSRARFCAFLVALLVACTPVSATPPPSVTNAPSATSSPSEKESPTPTPLPAPQAGDLGWLGKGSAKDIAWSPDGNWLAVVSTTGVYLYDTRTWQVAESILANRSENKSVESLAFFPDGKSLILTISSYPESFWRYTLDSRQSVPWLENAGMDPRSAPVFSPDGKTFALLSVFCVGTGSDDQTCSTALELRASATGELLHRLEQDDYEKDQRVNAFVFRPDGRQLAAANDDHHVRIWDTAIGSLIYTLVHDNNVADLAYSPDGRVLASTGHDATVRFWNPNTGENLFTQRGFAEGLQQVVYLENGQKLLVGQLYTNQFQVYALENFYTLAGMAGTALEIGEKLDPYPWGDVSTTARVRVSPDTRRMAVLLNNQVRIWDLQTGKPVLTLPGYNSQIFALAFNPNSTMMAVADHDVHLWDTITQEWIATLPFDVSEINDLAFHPDGIQLAVAMDGQDPAIWDVRARRKTHTVDTNCPAVRLAYSMDGSKLATAGWCGIKIWDVYTSQALKTFNIEEREPRRLAFDPDGSKLYLVGSRHRAAWNAISGKLLYDFPTVKGDYIHTAAISPHLAAVWQWSSPLQFFDPATGRHLYDFTGLEDYNLAVLSSKGDLLAQETGRTIELLDSASGSNLLSVDFYNPYLLAISPDNRLLAAVSYENAVHLWDVSAAVPLAENLPRLTATPAATVSPTPTRTPEIVAPLVLQPLNPPTLDPGAIRPETLPSMKKLGELGLGSAHAAAWSRDGKTLAIAASDKVYIFPAGASRPSRFLSADPGILRLVFSPNGRLLAGQIYNSAIQVLDVQTGRGLFEFDIMGCWNWEMAFSPDSQVLSADCGSEIYRWSMADGKLRGKEDRDDARPNSDGRLRVQHSRTSINLLASGSDEIIQTLDVPSMDAGLARFSPDGKTLLVWFYQYEITRSGVRIPGKDLQSLIQLWDVASGTAPTLRATLSTGKWLLADLSMVDFQGLAFTADSRRIFTASGDGQVQIWDALSGKLLATLPDATRIYLSTDGKRLATIGKGVRVWDVSPGKEPSVLWEIPGFSAGDGQLIITNDHTRLGMAAGGVFHFWAWDGAKYAESAAAIFALDNATDGLSISPDAKWLAYSTTEALILGENRPDAPNWRTILKFPASPYRPGAHSIAFSPDGSILAAADPNGKVFFWKLGGASAARSLELPAHPYIDSLVFSADGRLLAGSDGRTSDDATLYLWDLATGKLLREWHAFGYKLAFHPDGVTLAVSDYENGVIQLLDLSTGEPVRSMKGSAYIRSLAFNPDGSLLVVACDERIEVWEVATGKRLWAIEESYSRIAFSPGGKLLFLSYRDGRIQYWGLPEN